MTLEIDVLTLFPAMLAGPLEDSIPRRIQERGLATIRVRDLRSWGLGRHRSVDDYTYGGGAGMVLRPEPVAAALAELRRDDSVAVLLDPAGEPFRQATAQRLSGAAHLILLCPRYEGVDERIRALVDLELSIGDYVLTGGELAALVVMDAVMRLLPGAIEADSVAEESFAAGLLEYPQYTRPPTFLDMAVPAVLTSGDHGAVRRWRLRESLRRTLERRPDLLEGRAFTSEERRLLDEIAVGPNEAPEAGPGPSMDGEARADAEASTGAAAPAGSESSMSGEASTGGEASIGAETSTGAETPAGSEAATRAESSTGDEAPKDAGAPLRFSTPHGRASVGDDAAGR